MKKITFLLMALVTLPFFAQDILTSSSEEFFNGNTWIEGFRTEYTYDSRGNVTIERSFTDNDGDGNLEVFDTTTFTYNGSNLVTEENSENYKIEYTYTNNLVTLVIDYELINDVWVRDTRVEISYNENKIDTFISYGWDGQQWVLEEENSERSKYVYTGDNLTLITYEDYKSGTWVNGGKEEFTYDAQNRLTKEEFFNVNDNGSFKLEDFYNYSYDSNSNIIRETGGYFDEGNGTNVNFEPITYQYDTTMLMRNIINPFKNKFGIELYPEVSDNYINKILSSSSKNNRTTYNYNGATASVAEFNSFSFTAYPNPTTSLITIDDASFSLKNVEVYNVLGKKIITTFSNNINLENINSGVYVLKVNTNDGRIATKRIVKR